MTTLRRPASLDPRELGFTRRDEVPWLSPGLLLRTGARSALATILGAYLDKRELQGALPSRTYRQPGEDGELWLDYVADTGDGFDATYTVAYLLARPGLRVAAPGQAGQEQGPAGQARAPAQQAGQESPGWELPRGRVLVMGGDQVYPTASMSQYEDRLKGPYTAAMPAPPAEGPQPTLYALPGNHDWYDGLTSFLRLFVGQRADHIGGWRTEQTRSYFAIELPGNWWLFAIDEAFGAYLDDPQLVYFEQTARKLGPEHRVILAAPVPSWSKQRPKSYDTIDFFLRTVIAPTGAQVPLMIAGDQHYYARYSHPERELITCGGGGAYLTPTHTLPEQITVPPRTTVRKASPPRQYALASRFPGPARSRRLGWGVFGRLPSYNPGFATLLGVIHTLLMLTVAGAAMQLTEAEERLVTIPVVAMAVLVLTGAVGFACIPTGGAKSTRHLLAGLLHGLAHLGLGLAGGLLWLRTPFADLPWPLPVLVALLAYLPLAGLVAAELVALYLLVGSRFGINVNELFAAQGIADAKSFLRMHVAADGTLTVYPIGVDRVCRGWRADPEATAPDAPWVVPAGQPPAYRLIEPPLRIPGGAGTGSGSESATDPGATDPGDAGTGPGGSRVPAQRS